MSININHIYIPSDSNITNIYIPDKVVTKKEDYSKKFIGLQNLKYSYIGGGY